VDKPKPKMLTDEEWATVQRRNLGRFAEQNPEFSWTDVVGLSILFMAYDVKRLIARGLIPGDSVKREEVPQRGMEYSLAIHVQFMAGEMERAGFYAGGDSRCKGFVKWFEDVFLPAYDCAARENALNDRQRRLASAWDSFWHDVRAPGGTFDWNKRRGDLEAAVKWAERSLKGTDDGDNLRRADRGSRERDELLLAMYAANVDNVSQWLDDDGNLRISKRNLAEVLGSKRKVPPPPVSLDATHGDSDIALVDMLKDDIKAVSGSKEDREIVERIRQLCAERAKVKSRGRTVPAVRRNLEALANRTLTQADLADREGLDRGAVNRAFKKELAWLKEAMKKSAS
jgi:hypothetical protein